MARMFPPSNTLFNFGKNYKYIHPMMRIFFIAFISFLLISPAHAQYFYKDFSSNRQAQQNMAAYQEQKVRTIRFKSLEADGTASEGFFMEKKLSKDYKTSTLVSRSAYSAPMLSVSKFNSKGQLIETKDTSEISSALYTFSYDESDRLLKTYSTIISSDEDYISTITEEHLYEYGDDYYPEKMWLIKNQKDTTLILFSKDEVGNITIEKDTKTGRKYYYYYDSKSRITDIVHVNEYTEKMIPDYLFEYNASGQLTQMTTIEGSTDFTIWKYHYENGLRTAEKAYDRNRKLLGTIEYQYK